MIISKPILFKCKIPMVDYKPCLVGFVNNFQKSPDSIYIARASPHPYFKVASNTPNFIVCTAHMPFYLHPLLVNSYTCYSFYLPSSHDLTTL